MRSKIKYVSLFFLLLLIFTKVEALEVSKNDITMKEGTNEKIELYATTESEIKSVEFTMVFSTYDIPASFIVDSKHTDSNPDGIVHQIILGEPASGKILLGIIDINTKAYPSDKAGSISIHTAKAITTSSEMINLDAQTINVKIGTPEPTPIPTTTKAVDKDTNLLDKIESQLVKIELKKDVFEYTVSIPSTVTELDLKPVAKDEKTKVDVSSQKIEELKDNKITITAKLDDIEQKYIITVKNKKEIEVDTEEFKEDTSYKGKWIILSIFLGGILAASLLLSKKK